jgi:hypothetical protein
MQEQLKMILELEARIKEMEEARAREAISLRRREMEAAVTQSSSSRSNSRSREEAPPKRDDLKLLVEEAEASITDSKFSNSRNKESAVQLLRPDSGVPRAATLRESGSPRSVHFDRVAELEVENTRLKSAKYLTDATNATQKELIRELKEAVADSERQKYRYREEAQAAKLQTVMLHPNVGHTTPILQRQVSDDRVASVNVCTCGNIFGGEALFCGRCGKARPAVNVCKCGNVLAKQAPFCGVCWQAQKLQDATASDWSVPWKSIAQRQAEMRKFTRTPGSRSISPQVFGETVLLSPGGSSQATVMTPLAVPSAFNSQSPHAIGTVVSSAAPTSPAQVLMADVRGASPAQAPRVIADTPDDSTPPEFGSLAQRLRDLQKATDALEVNGVFQ